MVLGLRVEGLEGFTVQPGNRVQDSRIQQFEARASKGFRVGGFGLGVELMKEIFILHSPGNANPHMGVGLPER